MKVIKRIDWSKVNWVEQDIRLAESLGVSREAVRQARLRHHVGASPKHKYRAPSSVVMVLRGLDTRNMTIPQIQQVVQRKYGHLLSILKREGLDYQRRPNGKLKYDWSKLPKDWLQMTDQEIAVVVGVESPAVVAQWRWRHGYRKPRGYSSQPIKEEVMS